MVLAAALAVAPAAEASTHHSKSGSHAAHAQSSASHGKASSRSGRKGGRKVAATATHKLHGQQGIDSDRATEIQTALIREHYLSGPASGEWDSETTAAMQKYQADQGWQTKLMPDSRALKKLGLGADYSNAINAKTGTFGGPITTKTIPGAQAAGFTAASGVKE